ncbi:MAG: CHAP domain-containing protein [Alphaproteobacteria bacterium]
MLRVARLAALAAIAGACAACASGGVRQAEDAPALVQTSNHLECAVYARERSGITLFGDAYTWWDQAAGRYLRVNAPAEGVVLVLMNYAGPKRAHLAVVSRIVSSREIRVDHANWLNDGNLYLNTPVTDVSAQNDWSLVRLWNTRDAHWGGNTYPVQGFIAPHAPRDIAQNFAPAGF